MRKTKIICTIGPTSNDKDIILRMISAGMDVSRHNFSHGTHDDHQRSIRLVRKAAEQLGKNVAVLQDIKGPMIRTHKFANPPVVIHQGDIIEVVSGGEEVLGDNKRFSTTYGRLHQDLQKGALILIDDGLIALRVEAVTGHILTCRVQNNGLLSDNKSVHLPGVKTHLPALTEKDLADLQFGVEMGVDIVAASYIRKAEDIRAIRKVLRDLGGGEITLIAKIENQDGVDNVEDIIRHCDGIMVARGDMGVEIPAEEVPVIQKRIIALCNRHGKPVVTATQMLESMVHCPIPTRAEASDVTNAIFDGTDCIMLSGETANGKYPVDAVQTMARIADFAERNINYEQIMEKNLRTVMTSVPMAICYAAVSTARKIGATAIISDTVSGSTAKNVSRFRPESPVIAITPSHAVARRLSVCWGVFPIVAELYESTDEMIDHTTLIAKVNGFVKAGDLVVVTAGLPIHSVGSTNMIKVHQIT